MSANPIYSVPPHVRYEILGDEAVLLNIESERYFGLDDVGTRMWESLHTTQDFEASVAELAAHYTADAATLRRDLAALIDQLEEAGLLIVQRTQP